MSQTKFRHPKEMSSRKERVPLSTRVLIDTKALLEKATKENGLSLAELSSNILDDYANWLKNENSKKTK
jgi:hypothetical protein